MSNQWQAKRRLTTAALIVLTAGIVWLVRLDPRGAPPSTGGPTAVIPPKAERLKMSKAERIPLLERHGQVPEDADLSDWQLAEKTSWWGKPIDPKTFWNGRVIWLDETARSAANRRGRMFPPIPYEDPNLPAYANDEGIEWNSGTVEGPNWHFARSSKERAFWERFMRTMPQIPAKLERKQLEVAVSILEARNYAKLGNGPRGITSGSAARSEKVQKRRAFEVGYPQEAFTEDAILWAYVLARRRDYEDMLASGIPRDQPVLTNFMNRLAVDSTYITEPLTNEQIKATRAWKLTYLQRLRREKTDESYINAYLKAWNLSRAEVFGESEK